MRFFLRPSFVACFLGLSASSFVNSVWATGSTEGSYTAASSVAEPEKKPAPREQPASAEASATNPKAIPVVTQDSKVYFRDNYLFGDWGGLRSWLADKGVTFNGSITADFLANVSGGTAREFVPASSMNLEAILDLQRLACIPGAEFDVSAIWRTGNNLSAQAIGNLLTVAQLYGGQNLRLYNLFWKQSFFDHDLIFKVGRIGAFDDFLSMPMHWNYINNGFDGNPKGIFYNIPAFGNTVYPTSSWGIFGKYHTHADDWYIQAGLYGISSLNGANSVSGLNFTFDFDQGPGVLVQGGYLLNMKPGMDGLPGKYSMGAFYNHTKFTNYNGTGQSDSNGGVYWMFQQMVYRDPGEKNKNRTPGAFGYDSQTGLILWDDIVYTPDSSISQYPFYMNFGAVYQGLIPGREQDFLAFGWAWIQAGTPYSNYLSGNGQLRQTNEMVLELNYRCNLTRYFYIQPGVQGVLNPGATSTIPDAFVIGAQVGVTF